MLVRGCLNGGGLSGDIGPGGVEVGQRDQVHQNLHPIGIQEDLDVLFVMEELVNEHQ